MPPRAPIPPRPWRLRGWGVLLLLLMAGCGERLPNAYPFVSQPVNNAKPAPQANLVEASYAAVDAMLTRVHDILDFHLPILPTTFVDLDNLERSSPLGRLIARQMASRMTQRGFSVLEVRLRQSLLIEKNTGEFMLSREMKEIQKDYRVQAALVGTYSVAQNGLYVNAQLIRMKDQVVMASHDYQLPLTSDVRALLDCGPAPCRAQ